MIKIITTDCGKEAKELWTQIKKEVDKSEIKIIEVEHEITEITDGLKTLELMYTGDFEINIKCRKK